MLPFKPHHLVFEGGAEQHDVATFPKFLLISMNSHRIPISTMRTGSNKGHLEPRNKNSQVRFHTGTRFHRN